MTTKLILDLDTGIDDALALAYALASPEVELIGVTCTYGNVVVEQSVRNTLAILELFGRTDVQCSKARVTRVPRTRLKSRRSPRSSTAKTASARLRSRMPPARLSRLPRWIFWLIRCTSTATNW